MPAQARKDVRRSDDCTLRAIQSALVKTFTETALRHFRYGLSVRSASPDLRHIDVALGFLAGETYCCGTLSCDIPVYAPAWWRTLRQHLVREGLEPPSGAITLHLAVVSEAGHRLSVLGDDHPPTRFGFYEKVVTEVGALDRRRRREARRGRP